MNLTLEQYEKLIPRCELEHGGARMIFSTPNTGTRWRVETISTKEPWTLDWIAEFKPNDILVDVGANVGMYTIWAAATRGARVCDAAQKPWPMYVLIARRKHVHSGTNVARVNGYRHKLSFRPSKVLVFRPPRSCDSREGR